MRADAGLVRTLSAATPQDAHDAFEVLVGRRSVASEDVGRSARAIVDAVKTVAGRVPGMAHSKGKVLTRLYPLVMYGGPATFMINFNPADRCASALAGHARAPGTSRPREVQTAAWSQPEAARRR